MKCPECQRRMDMVVTGQNTRTRYVCMNCLIRYTFYNDGDVHKTKFKIIEREYEG